MSRFKETKTYGEEPLPQTIRGKELTLRPYCEETDEEPFYQMLAHDDAFLQPMKIAEKGKWFRKRYLKGRLTLIDWTGGFGFVIERNADKAILGYVTIDNQRGSSHHVLTLGYPTLGLHEKGPVHGHRLRL